ncbi:MAG: tRNA-uridine aminocarboxypropyltransferase [Shewanella sp.]
MSKRRYCLDCEYPQSACLCASINVMQSQVQLVVLQHPSEVQHAKNSVRLLKQVLPQCEVHVGELPEDFDCLRQRLAQTSTQVLVAYPSESSVAIETVAIENPAHTTVLLIDGTWRKALKILKLNPWLQEYQAVHLGDDYQGRYRIRKAKRSDSLSSLEAAAYSLAALENELDISPMLAAFDAMVARQIAAMPAAVQARYQEF